MMARLALLLAASQLLTPGRAFLYQPGSPSGNIVSEGKPGMGEIWDPSVTWWRGKWYAHAMYQKPGLPTNVYESGWLAVSEDGCHWEDGGAVAPLTPLTLHPLWSDTTSATRTRTRVARVGAE